MKYCSFSNIDARCNEIFKYKKNIDHKNLYSQRIFLFNIFNSSVVHKSYQKFWIKSEPNRNSLVWSGSIYVLIDYGYIKQELIGFDLVLNSIFKHVQICTTHFFFPFRIILLMG